MLSCLFCVVVVAVVVCCFSRFVRSIAGSPFGNEDLDLNDSLYVLYGGGEMVGFRDAFLIHRVGPGLTPRLSVQRFNPVLDSDADRVMETVSIEAP